MKQFLKIFVPILLALCIIAGIVWYLFFYDRGLTQDILLSGARAFREQGNLSVASWFYDRAYEQNINSDAIAIEKAQQYIEHGNFTQAEVALTDAIDNGGGVDVYIALSDTFVKQDKLLDAVELLNQVSDPTVKQALDELRPSMPTVSHPTDVTYNELITVSVKSDHTLYVSTNGKYPSVQTDGYTGSIEVEKGYTSIQAIAVSKNGLVSPLAAYGYTIVGIIEEVAIGDSSMEQQIRAGLGLSKRQAILTSDLWKITSFTVPKDAMDYSALSHMLYLENLTVESGISGQLHYLKNSQGIKSLTVLNTALTAEDMSAIGSLYSLESLTLDGCSLASTAPLTKLVSLKYLNLNNNAIGNISALTAMTELIELHLQRNALRDLSALAGCKKLTKLDISYNSLTSVQELSALGNLTYLDISHNQISDISPLSSCHVLKEFRANNNRISQLTALKSATSLEYVNVANNELTNLEPLGTISGITFLDFSYNQVTELPSFVKSSRLITIDGSYNKLSSLSSLSGLKSLNKVLMDYNEAIASVAELAECPVLIQVNVYGTKVKDVSILTKQSIIVNYNPTTGL